MLRQTTARRAVVVDGQRLDPQIQHMLKVVAWSGRPPLDTMPPVAARREFARLPLVFEDERPPLPRVEDRTIPSSGGRIPVRLFAPRCGGEPLPVLVYYHGGGGVIGSVEIYDGVCRELAREGRCLVVSVEYRLGPEHPFPAAPEDALAAFRWVARHAAELGGDPARVAVGGDSMGGSLSAVVAQLTRDEGGEQPCAQLLIYPAVDRTCHTRSREQLEDGFFLSGAMIDWFLDNYRGDADPGDPRISPLRHAELGGLAPAIVVTAGFDPLRDEGRAYADALTDAGVPVRYRCHESLIHGFVQMTGVVHAARRALHELCGDLRAIFDAG